MVYIEELLHFKIIDTKEELKTHMSATTFLFVPIQWLAVPYPDTWSNVFDAIKVVRPSIYIGPGEGYADEAAEQLRSRRVIAGDSEADADAQLKEEMEWVHELRMIVGNKRDSSKIPDISWLFNHVINLKSDHPVVESIERHEPEAAG